MVMGLSGPKPRMTVLAKASGKLPKQNTYFDREDGGSVYL
jgi:hypothetical protein